MVWNTITHPKMMANTPGVAGGTPMPLQHVSTGKQNVYDLILSVSQEGVTIAYGDYDDLCAKLVRGELVLCTSVALVKMDNIAIVQDYSVSLYKGILMSTGRTIHGKPVIRVAFDKGDFIIDCNNAVYDASNAPFDPTEPVDPNKPVA